VLDDERAAQAEKLILDRLGRQTPAQLGRLAAQAVVTVDPAGAARRRPAAGPARRDHGRAGRRNLRLPCRV
jgi:hypothetical protein